MIAIWNRKEVYMGYSMVECGEIRSILATNNIKYTYKVINRYAHGRGTRSSFGEKSEFSYMYYVYIHKKDYEWVYSVIRNSK